MSPLSRQSGFTLIEIMVVIVIIGALAVLVSFSLGGDTDRAARLQANRFIAVVNEVRDEAIIAGDNYAMTVDEKSGSYRFASTRSNAQALSSDVLFKVRKVDKGVELEWDVFEVIEGSADTSAVVLISSLGEITPFELRFNGEQQSYQVQVNQEGQLERIDKRRSRL